jgi:xylulokinase
MLSFGTTGLLTVTRRPLVESVTGPHFESEEGDAAVTWGANVLSAGRLVRWYAEHFAAAEMAVAGRTGGSVYDLLEAEAREVPPGAEGLIALPHLLGRRTPTPDPTIRGALLGLTPSHGPAHVYRALLESFAYNIRQGFEPLRPRIDRLVATAGGARSRLWRQIVADVLEAPLEYSPGASGALGIAFIAGYAVGLIEEFTEIKETWLQGQELTTPDPTASALYRRLFPLYVEFEEALAAPFSHLAERAERA